jgi:hypothetical protein
MINEQYESIRNGGLGVRRRFFSPEITVKGGTHIYVREKTHVLEITVTKVNYNSAREKNTCNTPWKLQFLPVVFFSMEEYIGCPFFASDKMMRNDAKRSEKMRKQTLSRPEEAKLSKTK